MQTQNPLDAAAPLELRADREPDLEWDVLVWIDAEPADPDRDAIVGRGESVRQRRRDPDQGNGRPFPARHSFMP